MWGRQSLSSLRCSCLFPYSCSCSLLMRCHSERRAPAAGAACFAAYPPRSSSEEPHRRPNRVCRRRGIRAELRQLECLGVGSRYLRSAGVFRSAQDDNLETTARAGATAPHLPQFSRCGRLAEHDGGVSLPHEHYFPDPEGHRRVDEGQAGAAPLHSAHGQSRSQE